MNFLIAPIKLIKQAIEAQEFQENHENEVRSLAEGERRCNEKKFSDLNRTLATERAEANKLRRLKKNLPFLNNKIACMLSAVLTLKQSFVEW